MIGIPLPKTSAGWQSFKAQRKHLILCEDLIKVIKENIDNIQITRIQPSGKLKTLIPSFDLSQEPWDYYDMLEELVADFDEREDLEIEIKELYDSCDEDVVWRNAYYMGIVHGYLANLLRLCHSFEDTKEKQRTFWYDILKIEYPLKHKSDGIEITKLLGRSIPNLSIFLIDVKDLPRWKFKFNLEGIRIDCEIHDSDIGVEDIRECYKSTKIGKTNWVVSNSFKIHRLPEYTEEYKIAAQESKYTKANLEECVSKQASASAYVLQLRDEVIRGKEEKLVKSKQGDFEMP